ncbi:hypothetical protein Tco_0255237 [Tanacetum coccineum]
MQNTTWMITDEMKQTEHYRNTESSAYQDEQLSCDSSSNSLKEIHTLITTISMPTVDKAYEMMFTRYNYRDSLVAEHEKSVSSRKQEKMWHWLMRT